MRRRLLERIARLRAVFVEVAACVGRVQLGSVRAPKRAVADLTLDKLILKEAAEGNF